MELVVCNCKAGSYYLQSTIMLRRKKQASFQIHQLGEVFMDTGGPNGCKRPKIDIFGTRVKSLLNNSQR